MDPFIEQQYFQRAAALYAQARTGAQLATIDRAIYAAAAVEVMDLNGAADAPILGAVVNTPGLSVDDLRTVALLRQMAASDSGATWEPNTEEPWWRKGDNLLKGAVRGATMGFEAGIDTLFSRPLRAGAKVVSGEMELGEAIGGFFGTNQEAAAEIGNPALFSALGEASHDWVGNLTWADTSNPVNLGEGYIPNSTLSQAAADQLSQAYTEIDVWEPTQQQLNEYAHLGWDREDLRLIKQTQEWRKAVDMAASAPGQAALGRPITQQSTAAREAVLLPVDPHSRWSVHGRGGVMQLSPGRVFSGMVFEPGNAQFDFTSGLIDFLVQIKGDPTLLSKGGKAARGARRAVAVTEEGVEHLAEVARHQANLENLLDLSRRARNGNDDALNELFKLADEGQIDERILEHLITDDSYNVLLAASPRPTIHEDAAMRLIHGRQAEGIIDALAKADSTHQVDTLLSTIRGRIPGHRKLRRQLKYAETRAEVVDAILPYVSLTDFHTPLNPVQLGRMRPLNTAIVGGATTFGAVKGGVEGWGEGEGFGGRAWETLQGAFGGGAQGFLAGTGAMLAPNLLNRGGSSLRAASLTDLLLEAPRTMFDQMASGLWKRPDSLIGAGVRANWRYSSGTTKLGRLISQNSPSQIDLDDLDRAYEDVDRLIQNWGLSRNNAIVEEAMDDLTRLTNGNAEGAFEILHKISREAKKNLVANGVHEDIAEYAVKLVREAREDGGLFAIDDIGNVIDYPGTSVRGLAGHPVNHSSPQLTAELFGGKIHLPDPSTVRRAVSEQDAIGKLMTTVTTDKLMRVNLGRGGRLFEFGLNPNFQRRAALRAIDAGVRRMWRPMVLLRLAFPIRIVGLDEQARMAAAGLDSMWAHPISYMAYTFGKRGGGGKGFLATRRFKSLRQMDEALEANSFGAIDFAEDWMDSTRSWNILGPQSANDTRDLFGPKQWRTTNINTPEGITGLHTELNQLWSSEVVAHLFRSNAADPVDDIAAWLRTEEGMRVLRDLTPDIDDARRMEIPDEEIRRYLDGVHARAHHKAGGDWIYKDENGRVFDSAGREITGSVELGPNHYDDGYTIIRSGNDEILESYRTGEFNGIHIYSANHTRDIAKIKKRLKEMRDVDGVAFPSKVKYAEPELSRVGELLHGYDRWLERMFDIFAGAPTARLSRSPAFKQLYYQRMTHMMQYFDEATMARFRKMAETDKMLDFVDDAAKGMDTSTAGAITDFLQADDAAKGYAVTAVQDLLFDLHKRANVSDAMWLVAPFIDAFIEVFAAWGKVIGQVPFTVTRRATQLVNGAREADPQVEAALRDALEMFGLDEDSLDEWGLPEYQQRMDPVQGVPGAGRGFFHTNDYGQEVFTYPFSAAAVELFDKLTPGEVPAMNLEGSVGALNMAFGGADISKGPQFLDVPMATFLPGFGPAVQWLSKGIPDEYKEINDLLNPFGETDLLTTFLPSPWMRRLTTGLGWVGGDERMYNNTIGDIQTLMMMEGRAGYGEQYEFNLSNSDEWQRFMKEAEGQARNTFLIRTLGSFSLPSSPSAPDFLAKLPEDVPQTYKDRITTLGQMRDLYNLLLREGTWKDPATGAIEAIDWDHTKATYEFNRILHQPDDWLFPYVLSVSATDTQFKRGLTEESFEWERQQQHVFNSAPATAYYLTPPELLDGDFYYPAYEQQIADGVREPISPEDRLKEQGYGVANLIWMAEQRNIQEAKDQLKSMRENRQISEDDYYAKMAATNAYSVNKKRELVRQYGPFDLYSGGADYSASIKQQIDELYQWPEINGLEEADPDTFEAVQQYLQFRDEALAALIAIDPKTGRQLGAGNTLMSRGAYNPNPTTMTYQRGMASAAIRNWLRAKAEELYYQGNFGMIWEDILSREMPNAEEEIYSVGGG